MSMLAEKKKKTKWVINPTKKPLWTSDSNGIKLGKELMERMGWSAGKGLGVNEQGMLEPLKVSYKNDTRGMGFKGNDDQWIEHQDEFNCFLNQLRNNDESSAVKQLDVEKMEVKSLEEKSKVSKARVHYQKFTRGKDLSKYSENDLACILGTNKAKNKEIKNEETAQEDSRTSGNYETNFGVTTINSGSIQDYFKKKWVFQNGINSKSDEVDEAVRNILNENSWVNNENEDYHINDKKHSKKSKTRLSCEKYVDVETTMMSQTDEFEKKAKKKKKKEMDIIPEEEEPEKKKRRKSDFDCINAISVEEDDCSSKKKKKSKNIFIGNDNDDNDLIEPHKKGLCISRTENKESHNFMNKKREKSCEELNSQDSPIFEEFNDLYDKDLKQEKREKKEKRRKLKNISENENASSNQNAPIGVSGEEENLMLETEVILKKKKKRSKNEKYFENDETENKVSHYSSMEILNNHNDLLAPSSGTKKKKKKDKNEDRKPGEKEKAECIENSDSPIFNSKVGKINVKCADEGEFTPEVESVKKKRKENKGKFKEEEFMITKPCQDRKIIEDSNEIKEISESELVKQKKKNKEKELVQIEDIGNTKREAITEVDSVKKKNKKKKKTDREKELVQVEDIEAIEEVALISEMESVKKKKKNKDKDKERDLIHMESIEDVKEVGVISKMESAKKKKKHKEKELVQMDGIEPTEEVGLKPEIESVKKKKKKKDKEKELVERESSGFEKEEVISEINLAKKKKKKKEKEKKLVDQGSYEIAKELESLGGKEGKFLKREPAKNLKNNESDINEICEEESKNKKKRRAPETDVVKKKKPKHNKNEVLEADEIDLTRNYSCSITTGLQENDQTNINGEELVSEEVSVKKKKKKKKDEKEILSGNEETGIKEKKHSSKKKNSKSGYEVQDGLDAPLLQSENKEISTEKEKKREQKFLENSDKDEKKEKKMEKTNINNYGKIGFRADKNSYARQGNNFNRINPYFSQRSFGGAINNFNLPSNNYSLDIRSSNILENNLTYPRYNLGCNFNNFNPLNNSSIFNLQNSNVLSLLNFLVLNSYFNNALTPVNNCGNERSEVLHHKTELLGEKNADKLYHGINRTQRVSRLLQMSDFSGFKGSNLQELLGYGIPRGVI